MLKPSMQELMKRVDNRYLLVNLAAQRARDLSEEEWASGLPLDEKPIKIALDEIVADKIEYRDGPKPQPEPAAELLTAASEEEQTEELTLAEESSEEETDSELLEDTDEDALSLPEEL